MDSEENPNSVIQYNKETENKPADADTNNYSNSLESHHSGEKTLKEILLKNSPSKLNEINADHKIKKDEEIKTKGEISVDYNAMYIKKEDVKIKEEPIDTDELKPLKVEELDSIKNEENNQKSGSSLQEEVFKETENSSISTSCSTQSEIKNSSQNDLEKESNESEQGTRGRKRKLSSTTLDNDSTSGAHGEDAEVNDESLESDLEGNEESDKPRRRGRKKGKKSMEVIPSHLSSDMVLGYKMLIKFLETPQFSGFHKPMKRNNETEEPKITCLNQIKKKFEDNSYNMISEFVKDIREMLINIYESRNTVAIKRALRLEQILEQRIAQLPNYLRPQCALVLPPEETNNSHNKIRISKGGGFVSLLLEKTEKQRYEKNKEKRKILAEERKQLKEEQDKDVQEWEKNVLLKDVEEDIKSMWELPVIGHFIHLCADILNIGEVAQFEVERMLLMPQCSDTLDLIMTALLTNSLMRAKLDRTPSMPYSIWSPLVRTRVTSWYRTWHKEGRNEQKLFEEIGIEPEFWQILGPEVNPLEYYYFHEISLFQRVWILKTLCDVDFIRKKTVHDNIRAQTLDELNPVYLGIDRHGNRYIQLKQFCASDIRIYRQSSVLEGDITLSEYVEGFEGFEHREGPITVDKVFRDIWELNDKIEVKTRKKKVTKTKKQRTWSTKVLPDSNEKKNLRKSVRAKQKTYVDWSDSDQSDTDLHTLKKKLTRSDPESLYRPFSDREFISLSVFRLPRDKVTKPTPKKSGYVKKTEDPCRNDSAAGEKINKVEVDETKEDVKAFGCEDEQSDSLDAKQMQDMQSDFEKTFHGDDLNGDEFDLDDKLNNFKLNKESEEVKFSVKNLEDLKVVFKKGSGAEGSEEPDAIKDSTSDRNDTKADEKPESSSKECIYGHNVPDHLKPDSSKFYLVVDSVEGLRQLISKFGSHENDLEMITRGTKSQRKKLIQCQSDRSCEIELLEKLQNLLVELEPWEIDFMKSQRSNKEKMYKEYTNFINRPADFVHPNESYWMKTCEEPATTTTSTTSTTSTTTTTTTATTTADGNGGNADKTVVKDSTNTGNDTLDLNQQDNSLDGLLPRRRTRVTRLQLQPEDNNDSDDDYDAADDYESNESDDNWVLPTSKKKAKKETTPKVPRYPRRSGGRRSKTSTYEKVESSTNTTEKLQNSSPEKTKKALFWGPRSSDPSEDLNWEKNRQKILEQHNSPVKKNLYSGADLGTDTITSENAIQMTEKLTASVITASPKRIPPPIPGNKKPYFSSAQLKAMENQAKQAKLKEGEIFQQKTILVKSPGVVTNVQTTDTSNNATNITQEYVFRESGSKTPVKIQTYSRVNSATLRQSPQIIARLRQPPLKQVAVPVVTKVGGTETTAGQESESQIRTLIQTPVNATSSKIQNVETFKVSAPGSVIQQKGGGQVQIRVQQSPDQGLRNKGMTTATSVANVRMQQPMQWQPKVITVQSVNQQGKIIHQQIQTQAQVQVQGQSQVQLQNQSQVQNQQVQQIIQVDPQKWASLQKPIQAVQVAADRQGTVQQMVITQPETLNPNNDLYVTDGKLLMKFDENFVQQLSKNKVVAVNVNDKLDLKKPLLIVKPKLDSNIGTTQVQGQQPTSQSNIVVVNKPVTSVVQQNVATSSVQNIVIPANYIIKENPNPSQTGQQTVKVVQQAPTYIIQQKAVAGKNPQPQIIKIITSQPMASNQGLILSPANVSGGSQLIRPVTQTIVATDQRTKSPTTIRFLRPQIATSTSQANLGTVPGQIIVNNIVQIQGQDVDASKTQVVAGKILSTGTPTVRLASPLQAQHVVASGNVSQNIKLGTQPLKVVVNSPSSQIQTPTSVTLNPQAVRPTGLNTVRLALSQHHQGPLTATSSIQSTPTATAVRVVTSAQSQPEQTILAAVNPQTMAPAAETTGQTLRVVTPGQPVPVQSQSVVTSANQNQIGGAAPTGQPVRLATLGQTQTVKLIANSGLGPRLIRQGNPGKVTVIASGPQAQGSSVPAMRPLGIPGQAVRFETVVQSTGSSNDDQTQVRNE